MAAPIILAEAQPRLVVDGTPVTVRLAGGGGAAPYLYGGNHYRAGIDSLPRIVTSSDFDGKDFGGGSVPQAMALRWAPGTNAKVAELAAYHWNDAAITVRIGPEGALPPVLTAGSVLSVASDLGGLTIALSDPAAALRKPILTARFAGSGGVEGPVEWKGKIKPRAWGRVFNLPGEPIDKANNIYCFGDPQYAWAEFVELRDKGAAAAPAAVTVLSWQGSIAATFAALQAAVAPQGGGVACPSIACVKWWTLPAGDLCADIRGEVGAGYVETAASVAARIAGVVSTVPFAAGTVAAANAVRPAAVGWRAKDENGTAAAALDTLLGDVSLKWVLDQDAISIRRWEWTAPVASARSVSVQRKQSFKPVSSRRLGYRQNQNVMSRDAIAGVVLVSNIAFDDGETLDDRLEQMISATEAADTLAEGKSTIFWEPTPPTAAESSEGDRWVDTDAGNYEYRRLPGNGRIAMSGTVATFAGSAIVYAPWAPAPDQRIGQALVDAAGAQATADRKVVTFNQEAMPTAEGVGDLWYQPSTKSLKRWDGTGWAEVATVGATPAQIAQITQALSDAVNAQATADGKIDSFYQPAPPAVFGEGDLWTDTDDGNKLYRASANSTAGGAWVLVRDTGIAAAIAAAAGAQGTADGKVSTFVGTVPPAATAIGDLWYNTATGELKRWSGAAWAATADNTALVQPSVTGPTPLSFSANYLGVLDSGQVPKDQPYRRLQGTTDVTTSTAWTILESDGVTVTIGAADGVANITAVSKDVASFTVRSVYGGVTRDYPVVVQRARAAAPVSTGSTGNPGTSGSVGAGASTISTSYGGGDSASFTCVAGTAGQVALSASLTVSLYASGGVFNQYGVAKAQWRVPGGTYADVGSEVLSDGPATYDKFDGPTDTSLSIAVTKTGLTSGSTYEFRLSYRKQSGTTGQTMSFSGTLAGTGS